MSYYIPKDGPQEEEARKELINSTQRLREYNSRLLANGRLRMAIDSRLTEVYLLLKDGDLGNLNGGKRC